MKKYLTITLGMILFPFTGFAFPVPENVTKILEQSGKNRTELEKVLGYYQNDSLKYAAACFLIENMDIHNSVTYYWVDSLNNKVEFNELDYPDWDSSISAFEEIKGQTQGIHPVPVIIQDMHVIKSDFLIENIDLAFSEWKTEHNKIAFNDFCEYILPYRIASEPLQDWRKLYRSKFSGFNNPNLSQNSLYPVKKLLKYTFEHFRNTFNHEQRKEPLP
ncbi:hypothetical protein D0T53_03470 [Dysgonomonas sp. 216]|uniref:hypothetical protein n=1 Tax=Dysgonomonas sp. 216 TaxID=2302934 RepID=UPI0013D4F2E1|nr:hypothetical protein [Dysgonomonas sp. 216]NDW17976.1 hypothetical protein [Dysgonomonas sp. 216]